MLLGIQDLLDNPNEQDPAQLDAFELYVKDREAYKVKIREQAIRNVPDSWYRQEHCLQLFLINGANGAARDIIYLFEAKNRVIAVH